jgi:hypothetical protein
MTQRSKQRAGSRSAAPARRGTYADAILRPYLLAMLDEEAGTAKRALRAAALRVRTQPLTGRLAGLPGPFEGPCRTGVQHG